ncbi:hypothetical protein [Aestuariivivens sediminis]|uniref:hypothetical protein n=1 Tax=Aestuariivivens sediminis TaxID=2913557 RepID=UPI001F562551|nr:hypothetical protein [Aestuariivivens sediminis]
MNNHNLRFWKSRLKSDDCPAVFSVGTGQNLPKLKVVEDLHELGYKIYSTNYVNGIKEFIEDNAPEDYSTLLDNFSSICDLYSEKENDRFRGDKNFNITETHIDVM